MGNKMLHRLMSGLLIAVFVLCLLVPTKKSFAAYIDYETVKYAKKITLISKGYKDASNRPYLLDMGSKVKGAKKVTIDIKGSGVYGDATENAYTGGYDINLYAHASGKAKLAVKVTKGGKVKTYKATIKVVDYKNPVKSLKIGSKNYAGKFKKYKLIKGIKFPSKKGKLTVTPAKNWKVKEIEVIGTTKDGSKDITVKKVKKYDLSKFTTLSGVFVTLTNKKTKAVEQVRLQIQ